MKIYDLKAKKEVYEFTLPSTENPQLIITTFDDFKETSTLLNIKLPEAFTFNNLSMKYETHLNYDLISLVIYELENDVFIFEKVEIIFTESYLLLIVDEGSKLHDSFVNGLIQELEVVKFIEDELLTVYYLLINSILKKMFDALYDTESYISNLEDTILMKGTNMSLSDIVAIKNECLQIKKINRQLLYVGDQIVLNENDYILEKDYRYLRDVDTKINQLYEYSVNVHEMSSHLMDLYNSKVSSKTNNALNKLTIISVFTTPITILTGLYGMNFVNMPELQHPYGYYIVLGVMVLISLIIYYILRKMKLL